MDIIQKKISWYRSPVSREQLQELNQRSNFRGFLQAGGFLGLLTLTGSSACFAAGHLSWPVVVVLFFIHGTCWLFLLNGFHELVHNSVFRTKSLNGLFLRIFGFLTWFNPHLYWASHTEHHKYTLHPPDDLEVMLPLKLTFGSFLLCAFVNPVAFWRVLSTTVMMACGKLNKPWYRALFAEADPAKKRQVFNWARLLIAGHLTILVISVIMKWWLLPVVITFAPFYGTWLYYLCNNTQHTGLQDNVSDFRLCCRTFTVNPFIGFLYWHMNYHTEHHMYAAVPCYNLKKLHKIIESDLPKSEHGLCATWKQIITILNHQKFDPTYQFNPELPQRARI